MLYLNAIYISGTMPATPYRLAVRTITEYLQMKQLPEEAVLCASINFIRKQRTVELPYSYVQWIHPSHTLNESTDLLWCLFGACLMTQQCCTESDTVIVAVWSTAVLLSCVGLSPAEKYTRSRPQPARDRGSNHSSSGSSSGR